MSHLHETLYSKAFKETHRVKDVDFTRERQLTLPRLCLLLIGNMQTSYTNELHHIYEIFEGDMVDPAAVPGKSALSKARKKLKHTAFTELNQELLSYSQNQIVSHRKLLKGHVSVFAEGPDKRQNRYESPDAIFRIL